MSIVQAGIGVELRDPAFAEFMHEVRQTLEQTPGIALLAFVS